MAAPLIQDAIDSGTNASLTGQVTLDLGTDPDRGVWAQLIDVTTAGAVLTDVTLDGASVLADVVGPTNLGGFNSYNLQHKTTLTGSKVLLATWDLSGFKSVIAVALFGIDATTPFSGRQTQYLAPGTGLTLTITSDTDSLVLLGTQEFGGATLTPGAGSSAISGISGSFRHGLQEAGASSVTIGGTWGSSTTSWASGVSVKGTSSGYTLLLEAGTYTLAGAAVDLLANRTLPLEAGAYSLAGSDVALLYEQPGVYVINLEAGSYTLTGQNALVSLSMNLEAGVYNISGSDLDLILTEPNDYVILLDPGVYNLSGSSVRLDWSGAPDPEGAMNKLTMSLRIGV